MGGAKCRVIAAGIRMSFFQIISLALCSIFIVQVHRTDCAPICQLFSLLCIDRMRHVAQGSFDSNELKKMIIE